MTALLHSGTTFDHVLDAEGRIVPKLIAEQYHIPIREVGSLAGVRTHTLMRRDRMYSRKTQQRLREMMNVMSRAEAMAGGHRMRAYAWYRSTPIPAFGNLTASQLVHDGHGEAVMDYLNALAEGGHE